MQLSPGAVIRGRVLGARPEEMRSVTVHAFSEATGVPRMAAMSPGAAYRIDDAAPGEWMVIALIPPDVSVQETVEVAEGAGEVVLDLELPAGFTLTGRVLLNREPVLSPAGLPVADAVVVLERQIPELGSEGPVSSATSDERGAFEVLRLPAGTYSLTVEADGFAPFESRVVVAPGGTVHLDVALGVSP